MIKKWRYELKYIVTDYSNLEIISMIKRHPVIFSEIFHERRVNNIYFDTPNFSSFSDNVVGISERLKTRIRWYGQQFGTIHRPILELKIKKAMVGKKESNLLNDFSINEKTSSNDIIKMIKHNNMSPLSKKAFLLTKPVLMNSYIRRYFISSCKRFRITYDTKLTFYSFTGKKRIPVNTAQSILEVKFSSNDIIYANDIMSYFPFRLNKSSKYVTGINHLVMMPNIY